VRKRNKEGERDKEKEKGKKNPPEIFDLGLN